MNTTISMMPPCAGPKQTGWWGINATRALTCKGINAQLSCGRVQTPTLAIIASREEEIRNFVPKPYYGIAAKSQTPPLTLTWRDEKSKSFLFL